MKKNLLKLDESDIKALNKMGYTGSVEKVSRYCDLSQKLFNVFLVAYDQGIKQLTFNQIVIIWYKLYGNNLQTAQQIRCRLHTLKYSSYLTSNDNGEIEYSLIEDKIDKLRYELSLKSSEHKPCRLTPTKESIYTRFDKEIAERLVTKNNKKLLDKLKTISREQLIQLAIIDLPFTNRVKNCLVYDDIKTIKDLIKYKTAASLLRIPNFGQKCLKEIKQVLSILGLTLENE